MQEYIKWPEKHITAVQVLYIRGPFCNSKNIRETFVVTWRKNPCLSCFNFSKANPKYLIWQVLNKKFFFNVLYFNTCSRQIPEKFRY